MWTSTPPCPACPPCPTCPDCPACVKHNASYETGELPTQGTLNLPASHHFYDCSSFSDPTQLTTLSDRDTAGLGYTTPCVFKNEADAANFCSANPECIAYMTNTPASNIPVKNLYDLSAKFKYKQCHM